MTSANSTGASETRATLPTPRTGFEAVDDVLAAPFESTHHDVRGGIAIEYLTGEQVISRLLAVLGNCGWSFRVLQHDIHLEADEVWVLGELRLHLNPDDPVVRQQFGSSKIKRARTTGAPLDIGFDLKAAATDCLKKCATLVGVGLYLTRKEDEPARSPAPSTEPNGVRPRDQRRRKGAAASRPGDTSLTRNSTSEPGAPLVCEQCGHQLQPTKARDGSTWTPGELAAYTRQQSSRILCADCARSSRAGTVRGAGAGQTSRPSGD